jgi:hypothetical protein
MNTYTVRIKVDKTYDFEDEIEAADEVVAEQIAKDRLWRGDYEKEERACSEITNEIYEAEEMEEFHKCPVCTAKYGSIVDEEKYELVDTFYEDELVIHKP